MRDERGVSIGVDMIHDPPLSLLDEPTSGLDSTSALQVIELLSTMAKAKHRTIILSIHRVESDEGPDVVNQVVDVWVSNKLKKSKKDIGKRKWRAGNKNRRVVCKNGRNKVSFLVTSPGIDGEVVLKPCKSSGGRGRKPIADESLSDGGIFNRNRLISDQAEATWKMEKKLGLQFKGKKEDLVKRFEEFEVRDGRAKEVRNEEPVI